MHHREVAWLRNEVSDLRQQLEFIRGETNTLRASVVVYPWLRIAGTVATTCVSGRIVQGLRPGAPGAAAMPMIAAQLAHIDRPGRTKAEIAILQMVALHFRIAEDDSPVCRGAIPCFGRCAVGAVNPRTYGSLVG